MFSCEIGCDCFRCFSTCGSWWYSSPTPLRGMYDSSCHYDWWVSVLNTLVVPRLQSSENLGLVYDTYAFFSVIYVLCPLFAFSYHKSLATASHCPPCVSVCVCWCQLSAPHRQPRGLVEGGNWSAFAKDMQNHCWLQWVFVFRVTTQELAAEDGMAACHTIGTFWCLRRFVTLEYTDILTGAEMLLKVQ